MPAKKQGKKDQTSKKTKKQSYKVNDSSDFDSDLESAPDSNSDSDSFCEESKPTPKGKGKRKATAKDKKSAKSIKRKKTFASGSRNTRPADISDSDELGLEDIDYTLDETTPTANRFVNLVKDGLREKKNIRHEHTPLHEQIQHIRDLPFYDEKNRSYVLLEEGIELYDHEMCNGTSYRAWRIQARNMQNPNSDPVDLFTLPGRDRRTSPCPPCLDAKIYCDKGHPACRKCVDLDEADNCVAMRALREDHGDNIIEERICSDRSLIMELGKIKVDLMNRMPEELDIARWKHVGLKQALVSQVRTFIDVTSLVEWKRKYNPTIDLNDLQWTKSGSDRATIWTGDVYCLPLSMEARSLSCLFRSIPGLWIPSTENSNHHNPSQTLHITVSTKDDIDMKKLECCLDTSGYGVYETRKAASVKDSNTAHAVALQVGQEIAFQLCGYIGSLKAFTTAIDERRDRFLMSSDNQAYRLTSGSYNDRPIWGIPKTESRGNITNIKLSNAVTSNLTMGSNSVAVPNYLRTAVQDRACIAFIIQQSYHALAQGERLLRMLFAAFLAAQKIEDGHVTRKDVLKDYCVCVSDEMKVKTEHVCMDCFSVCICQQMGRRATPDGFLVECRRCLDSSIPCGPSLRPLDLQSLIKFSVKNLWKVDLKDGQQQITGTVEAMTDYLVRKHMAPEDSEAWIDGYSGQSIRLVDGTWSSEQSKDLTGRRGHPMSMSVEKPHSRWLRSDGVLVLHDVDNVTLTPDCINRLKLTSPVACIPQLKKAMLLKKRAESRPPCRGYYPDVEKQWKALKRGSDW